MKTFGQYLKENAPPMGGATQGQDPDVVISQMINVLVKELKDRIKLAIPTKKKPQGMLQKMGNWWKNMNDPNYDTPDAMAARLRQQHAAGINTGQPNDLGESFLMPTMPIEVHNFFQEAAKEIMEVDYQPHDLDSYDPASDPSKYHGSYGFTPRPDVQASLRQGQAPPPSPADMPGSTHLGGNHYYDQRTGQSYQVNPVAQLGQYLDGEFKKRLKGLVTTYMRQKQQNNAGKMWGAGEKPTHKMNDTEFEEYLNGKYGPQDKRTLYQIGQVNTARSERKRKMQTPQQPSHTDPNVDPDLPPFPDDGGQRSPAQQPLEGEPTQEPTSVEDLMKDAERASDIKNKAKIILPDIDFHKHSPEDVIDAAKEVMGYGSFNIKQFRQALKMKLDGGIQPSLESYSMVEKYKRMLREQAAQDYIPPVVKWFTNQD